MEPGVTMQGPKGPGGSLPSVPFAFETLPAFTTLPNTFTEVPSAAPDGGALTKADGGRPPSVSASCALKAYGTLTSSTRVCSASPCTCTPSQRCSCCEKRSPGNPAAVVLPSSTLYWPFASGVTFCVSCQTAAPPSCCL